MIPGREKLPGAELDSIAIESVCGGTLKTSNGNWLGIGRLLERNHKLHQSKSVT